MLIFARHVLVVVSVVGGIASSASCCRMLWKVNNHSALRQELYTVEYRDQASQKTGRDRNGCLSSLQLWAIEDAVNCGFVGLRNSPFEVTAVSAWPEASSKSALIEDHFPAKNATGAAVAISGSYLVPLPGSHLVGLAFTPT